MPTSNDVWHLISTVADACIVCVCVWFSICAVCIILHTCEYMTWRSNGRGIEPPLHIWSNHSNSERMMFYTTCLYAYRLFTGPICSYTDPANSFFLGSGWKTDHIRYVIVKLMPEVCHIGCRAWFHKQCLLNLRMVSTDIKLNLNMILDSVVDQKYRPNISSVVVMVVPMLQWIFGTLRKARKHRKTNLTPQQRLGDVSTLHKIS